MSLDADLLNRVAPLRIKAAQWIDALPPGIHPSRRSGQSLELSDPRMYRPGDEIRHIDWRASGKRDHLFVRQFTGERRMRMAILLDLSPSMTYRHRADWSKQRVSIHLAAVLFQLFQSQGDAAGLVLYGPERFDVMPPHPTPNHTDRLFDRLEGVLEEEVPSSGKSQTPALAKVLRRAQEQLGTVHSWIVLSDYLDEDPLDTPLLGELRQIRSRDQEVVLFQILEQATELKFRFGEKEIVFEDLESGERLDVGQGEWIEESRREAASRQERWRAAMLAAGAEWVEVDTEHPVVEPVYRWVEQRNGRSIR